MSMGPSCHCAHYGLGKPESCCPVHGTGTVWTPKVPPYILTDHLLLEEGHWIAVLRDDEWISGVLQYDTFVDAEESYDTLLFLYGPRSSAFYPSRDLASNHTVVVLSEPKPKKRVSVTDEAVLGLEYVIEFANPNDKVQAERLTRAANKVIKSKEENAS